MKTIEVRRPVRYDVVVGSGVLAKDAVAFCSRYSRCLILTDSTVAALHLAKLDRLRRRSEFVVPPGEDSKSFATLAQVLDAMVAAGLDRGSLLVALGGGVIGDLGGMAAGLYMRGIDCVQMPTTLLSMVDSSVGGKTAVNLPAGKNLAGLFHHPRGVFADTSTLATLPEEEYRSGLGEVVKTAVLGGFLDRLGENASRVAKRDPDILEELVHDCVEVKAQVVSRDPYEKNIRKHLNLGHTFGHGIEHAAGFGRIPHGIAVGVGLVLALRTAQELEKLAQPGMAEQTCTLLKEFSMPTSLVALRETYDVRLDPDDIVRAMRHDKKGAAGKIMLVLPVIEGVCLHDVAVDEPTLTAILREE